MKLPPLKSFKRSPEFGTSKIYWLTEKYEN